jgi:hypothetical protein
LNGCRIAGAPKARHVSKIDSTATEAGTWSLLEAEKAAELKTGVFNFFAAQHSRSMSRETVNVLNI